MAPLDHRRTAGFHANRRRSLIAAVSHTPAAVAKSIKKCRLRTGSMKRLTHHQYRLERILEDKINVI
jgi:hypothetical protein